MLVPRANTTGATVGVLAGFGTLTVLYFTKSKLSFMWYALLGTCITVILGWLVSLFTKPPRQEQLDTLVFQRRPKAEN